MLKEGDGERLRHVERSAELEYSRTPLREGGRVGQKTLFFTEMWFERTDNAQIVYG